VLAPRPLAATLHRTDLKHLRRVRLSNRPPHVRAPDYLTKSPPVPEPQPIAPQPEFGGKDELEPTRYGDWEHKGIAWDF